MMKWKLSWLVIVVTIDSIEGQGKWKGMLADNNDWYYMIDHGLDIMSKNWLIIGIKACQGAEMLFLEKHKVVKYVYVRLGDKSTGIEKHSTFADKHCASGTCSTGDEKTMPLLNCNKYIPLWFKWNNKGLFTVGVGLDVGNNKILLQMDYADTFDLRLVKVSMKTSDKGTWLFLLDNPPVFSFPSTYTNTSIEVREDIAIGNEVVALAATDPEGDSLTFTVVGMHADVFVCDGTSLKTNRSLDYETRRSYYITIELKDKRNTVVAPIAVHVVNVIDETPSIILPSIISMPEELLNGTSLAGFYFISDRDFNDTLSYNVTGPDSGFFSIDTNTSALVVRKRVDRDGTAGKKQLEITVIVTDSGNLKAVSDIVITVMDVNDNPPLFSQPFYVTEVKENAGNGLKILHLNCSDADDGVNGDTELSIISGDDPRPHFTMTGQDLYVDSDTIDYESLNQSDFTYTLTVQCTDNPREGNTYTASAVVTVKILPDNEHKPKWLRPLTDAKGVFPEITYNEDIAPSTLIETFLATDNDLGNDGLLSYDIISVTTNDGSSVTNYFLMESVSGVLRTATNLDRDKATGGFQYFDIVVMATDHGTPQKNVTGTLRFNLNNVNDNPSTFDQTFYNVTLPENTAPTYVIIKEFFTDYDGDAVTVFVTGDWSDMFYVNNESVLLAKPLDYEVTPYMIAIISLNDGNHTVDATLAVKITDICDESPRITVNNPLVIYEELPVGTAIGGVFSVRDDDKDDTLTYSITDTDSQYFNINSTTGILSVKQRIDADVKNKFTNLSVRLVVEDSAGLSDDSILMFTIIDVNDNSPEFERDVYVINVTENTSADTLLLDFNCSDKDPDNNGAVRLFIDSGNHGNWFKIQGMSLYTNSVAIDYEEIFPDDRILLTVLAEDTPKSGPPKSDVAVVIVQVLPSNEYAPNWVSPAPDSANVFPALSLAEDVVVGSHIETFTASDRDSGVDGVVLYSVLSVVSEKGISHPGYFVIHAQFGQLMTNASLDADDATGGVTYYDITIVATDTSAVPKSVTGTVRITINNTNDNAPFFFNYSNIISVAENTTNFKIGIDAGDIDGDDVNFIIVEGDKNLFNVVGKSLFISGNLDFEEDSYHILILQATDGLFKINVTLIINVTDIEDEKPVITVNKDISILEEQPIGSPLCNVFDVQDKDRNSSLTYTLTGTDATQIEIDKQTGILSISARIDQDGVNGVAFLDQLLLTVTDSAGLSNSVELNISVSDINDNTPAFSSITYMTNVTEGAASSVILQMTCVDADSGLNGKMGLSVSDGDDTDSKFSISGFDLTAFSEKIDYEVLQDKDYKYTLTVIAVDKPVTGTAKTGLTFVTVQVLPVNEFTPKWLSPTTDSNDEFPSLTITEATLPGSNITQFTAKDNDLGQDGEISYGIISQVSEKGTSETVFTIDQLSGILRVSRQLDADSVTGGVDYYILTIKAEDGGSTQFSTTGTMTIHLENINDNAPVLTNYQDTFEVAENTSVGTVIVTMTTSDYDGDNISLAVVGGDLEYFTGDGNQIKTLKTLDYESQQCYTVVISMSDGKYSENLTLTISVTDVIDESPVLHVYSPLTVLEELPVGTVIGTAFYTTDSDRNDELTYLLTGRDMGIFDINSTNGLLSIKDRIDTEGNSAVSSLEITVTVRDQGGLTDSADLIFTVLDVNDNSPTFSQSVYTVNVTEETLVSEELLELNCSDSDSGNNGQFTVSVSSGDSDQIFTITGTKLFVDGSKLDFESLTDQDYRITLTVEAVDSPDSGQAKTGVAVVLVQVLPLNEFFPEWTHPAFDPSSNCFRVVTIREDISAGENITKFEAEDKDVGSDGDIIYKILSVTDNTGRSSPDIFMIDSSSGIFYVVSSLDRDSLTGGLPYYNITVIAMDSGSPVKNITGTFQIVLQNINDNAPLLEDFHPGIAVSEDIPVGSVIQTLNVVDADGDNVTVIVVAGETEYILIEGNSMKLNKALDYEKQQCHTLIISLTDGTHNTNVTFTITVKDVNEDPSIHVIPSLTLFEELPTESVIGGAFYVTDNDVDDTHIFSGSGRDMSYFDLNSTNGLLSVKDRIDLEGNSAVSSLEITVTVRDQGGLTDSADLIFTVLDVNDNSPTFSQSVYTVNVTEATSVSEELLELNCSDSDSGNNGQFTVSVSSGDSDQIFTITGTKLFVDGSKLDFESLTDQDYRITLTVEAVDSPDSGQAKTGVAVVLVQVLPLNEFAPEWMAPSFDMSTNNFVSQTIKEDVSVGTNITTFKATDKDVGTDGDVVFSIVSITDSSGASSSAIFVIDSYFGMLRVASSLDSDASTGGVAYYNVLVAATDSGSVVKSVTGTLQIILENVNDNIPFLENFDPSLTVAENTPVGNIILTLTVVDHDGDDVAVSMVGGDDVYFMISGNNVKLKKDLDYEKQQCHTVVFSLNDAKHQDNITLTISVVDVNEGPVIHVFTPLTLPEELSLGTSVGAAFYVTDSDEGDIHTYSLSGQDMSYFDLNSTNGLLSIKDRIDIEGNSAVSSLEITVTVRDQGGLTDSADLIFTVLDVNDNSPSFSQSVYTVNVTEATSVSEELLELNCSDSDSGNNGQFTVSVSSGDSDQIFTIAGTKLFVDGSKLDFESLTDQDYRITLTVEAVDSPDSGQAKTGVTVVVVLVSPMNEFPPVWASPSFDTNKETFPDKRVKENLSPGSNISTFQATDDDQGRDGDVTYLILSTTDNTGKQLTNIFTLETNTGILHLSTTLDSDVATGGVDNYTVVVAAVDGGYQQKSVTGSVIVHIENVNDNKPVLQDFQSTVNMSEAAVVGDIVAALTVIDFDIDDNVSVSVVDGDVQLFKAESNYIKLARTLDYESVQCHSIGIQISDGKHDQNVTLTVHVTDVNDNSPQLTVYSPILLPEKQPTGTKICGLFSVTDADVIDTLTFTLSGSEARYFSINHTSGIIKLKEVLDKDKINSTIEDVVLTVTDSAGNTDNKTLTFDIQDINDNSPVFSQWIYIINATEGKIVNGPLLTFDVTDGDSGGNGEVSLSVDDGDDVNPLFSISQKQLYVNSSRLDYEALRTKEYLLSVRASDSPLTGLARSSFAMVVVKVLPLNEFTPEWVSPTPDATGMFPNLTIPENISLGFTAATFNASDDDDGEDGMIEYSLVTIISDSGVSADSKFKIDPTTGTIHSSDFLDRDLETGGAQFYDLKLTARDRGNPSKEVQGTVRIYLENVNDNKPRFQTVVDRIDVLESTAVGQTVYSVTVTDEDGDFVNISVLNSDKLRIDGKDVKIVKKFDFLTDKCMSFTINARDGIYETNMTLFVNVVDVADQPPLLEAGSTRWMQEELAVGSAVCGLYYLTDADTNDTHTYTLEGSDMKYFAINTKSGVITVAERIDCDGTDGKKFITDLKLTVTDSAGLQDSIYLNISVKDVNDNSPVFSQPVYYVNLTENTAANSQILMLLVKDVDSGKNADITLSLNNNSELNSQFKIEGFDLKTGAVNTDYDSLTENNYKVVLEVAAVDNPETGDRQTATTVVIVEILPLNENSPVWRVPTVDGSGRFPDIVIDEDIPPGTNVSTFQAADDDKGADGVVTYHVVSVTTDTGLVVKDVFSLDSESGIFRTMTTLDRDVDTGGVRFYDVTVEARDGNTSPLTTQGTVRILLNNVNDNPPLSHCFYVAHVKENVSVGDTVLTLPVYDADNESVSFTLSNTDVVDIKYGTSDVQVVKILDFETQVSHTAQISVTDGKHVVNSTLILMVVDVNDETPEITTNNLQIPEEMKPGSEICGAFTVTDKDDGDRLTFYLDGEHSDYFAIDSLNGVLKVNKPVDRDAQEGITFDNLTLTVRDEAGHRVSSSLNLTVIDINDNSPVCTEDVINVTVKENSEDRQYLTSVKCTDIDSGSNGNISISVADDDRVFYLTGSRLYVNGSSVDYEKNKDHFYTLVIKVTDLPVTEHTHTTQVLVYVTILSENEYDPEWSNPHTDNMGMFPDISVDEDTMSGKEIFKVSAVDDDDGADGDVRYKIKSAISSNGDDSVSVFNIDSSTGSLTIVKMLDADSATGGVEFYILTVEARDLGNVARKTTGTVKIILQPVNDNPPKFSSSYFKKYISCKTVLDTEILKLTVYDADGDSDVWFSVVNGSSDVVEVNPSTGSVMFRKFPSLESTRDFEKTLKVRVGDVNDDTLHDEAYISIVFEDCSPPVRNCSTVSSQQDVSDLVSEWTLRGLLMVFGMGMMVVIAMYMKLKLCSTNAIQDIKAKSAWEKNALERPESFEHSLPMDDDLVLEDEPPVFFIKK